MNSEKNNTSKRKHHVNRGSRVRYKVQLPADPTTQLEEGTEVIEELQPRRIVVEKTSYGVNNATTRSDTVDVVSGFKIVQKRGMLSPDDTSVMSVKADAAGAADKAYEDAVRESKRYVDDELKDSIKEKVEELEKETIVEVLKEKADAVVKDAVEKNIKTGVHGRVGSKDNADWKTVVHDVKAIGDQLIGHTVKIPAASAESDGYMSIDDWNALQRAEKLVKSLNWGEDRDISFSDEYTSSQLESMTDAVDGRLYIAIDGGLYIGKDDGRAELKSNISHIKFYNESVFNKLEDKSFEFIYIVKGESDKYKLYCGDVCLIDTTQYSNQTINTMMSRKQDKLEDGNNIKTIGGQSILGKGNIDLPFISGVGVKNMVVIKDGDYEELKKQSKDDPQTLYIVIPDSEI